jgi:hypothetical protein
MNALASPKDFADIRPVRTPLTPGVPGDRRAGLWRRIYDAVMEARQRQTERDIVRIVGQSGWHLTDDLERRITEHLTRNPGFRV